MRQRAAPRQADVASLAGVSVSTVSRVLGNAPGISDAVRKLVADAAMRAGYAPSRREERSRRRWIVPSGAVPLFAPMDVLSNDHGQFYGDIIAGAREELAEAGAALELVPLLPGPAPEFPVAARLAAAAPGPALLLAIDDPGIHALFGPGHGHSQGRPAVLVNGTEDAMRLDSLSPSNYRGALAATRYLVGLGHRRIAHVTWLERQTIRDRLAGFRDAMREAGIPPRKAEVVPLPDGQTGSAYAAVSALLSACWTAGGMASRALPFTAAFCANDLVAIGVQAALRDAGYRVPQDCSVMGFDDAQVAALAQPALTTMRVDRRGLGRQAVRRLLDRLDDPDATPASIHLACTLVVRDSTGPA